MHLAQRSLAAWLSGVALAVVAPVQAQGWTSMSMPTHQVTPGVTSNAQLERQGFTVNNSFLDRYELRGRKGDVYTIQLSSSAFDPFLRVSRPGDSGSWTDDDSGPGTNARLTVRFERDETYYIGVSSVEAHATGWYSLTVFPPDSLRPSGQRLRAELSAGDYILRDGRWADIYAVDVQAGQSYSVSVQSDAFDAMLHILDEDLELLEEDDDSGGDSNPELEFEAPYSGRIFVVVLPYEEGEEGDYRVNFLPAQAPAPPPAPTPTPSPTVSVLSATPVGIVLVGQPVAGSIRSTDSRACDPEALCDIYLLDGRAGDRLVITMVATSDDGALDPVLMLFGPDGSLVGMHDDTDEPISRNPRLEVTLAVTGRYRIGARSYSANGAGPYVLEVRRRP